MSDLTLAGKDALETTTELYVVFKVGETEYALPADTVVQMESFTGATRVPGTSPFVAGIIQVRGRVVPVMDLRLRFGLPSASATLDTRVVVGQLGDRAVALLADSAREVLKLSRSQLKPPPRLLDDGASGFVKAVAQVGPRMVMVIDFAKVIGEEAIDVEQR
jgi:purine-binding chemotaxis protein CheW